MINLMQGDCSGVSAKKKKQELYMEEPCKITVEGGWLEITPTSGES